MVLATRVGIIAPTLEPLLPVPAAAAGPQSLRRPHRRRDREQGLRIMETAAEAPLAGTGAQTVTMVLRRLED